VSSKGSGARKSLDAAKWAETGGCCQYRAIPMHVGYRHHVGRCDPVCHLQRSNPTPCFVDGWWSSVPAPPTPFLRSLQASAPQSARRGSKDPAITSSGEAHCLWQLVVGFRVIVSDCSPRTPLLALAYHCSQGTERIVLGASVVFTGPHGEAH
jgi:hypothetical protein